MIAIPQHNQGTLVFHRDDPDRLISLGPHPDVRGVAVSPDGHWIATASHGASKVVKIWDAASGEWKKDLPSGHGRDVLFSPDGRWLVTSGDRVYIWRVDTWEVVASFEAPRGFAMAFSPDCRILAIETNAGIIRLVDPETEWEYARLEDPYQDVARQLSFTPDGARLVARSDDCYATHVWDLRAIRGQLADIGLDWEPATSFPNSSLETKPTQEVKSVQVLPDEATVFRRGHELADLGNWREAAADYSRAFQLQFPAEPARWLEFTDLQLWTDDIEGYRQTCRSMLKRFGSSQNPDDISFLAHVCVLGPDALGDAARVLQLAEQRSSLTAPPSKHHYWSIHVQGLAYCRAAQYERAVKFLETNQQTLRDWGPNVLNWLVLALAHAQLHHSEESKKWLDQAQEWIKTNTPGGGRPIPHGWDWRDWLELQVLRQEAENLIQTKNKDLSSTKPKSATPVP